MKPDHGCRDCELPVTKSLQDYLNLSSKTAKLRGNLWCNLRDENLETEFGHNNVCSCRDCCVSCCPVATDFSP